MAVWTSATVLIVVSRYLNMTEDNCSRGQKAARSRKVFANILSNAVQLRISLVRKRKKRSSTSRIQPEDATKRLSLRIARRETHDLLARLGKAFYCRIIIVPVNVGQTLNNVLVQSTEY